MFPLYFDEDSMARAVIAGLLARGVEAHSVSEVAMGSADDPDQLAFATARGWTVVTANVGDYAGLNSQWLAEGRSHAGIILLTDQRIPIGSEIRALLNLQATFSPEEMVNRLEYLSTWLGGRE